MPESIINPALGENLQKILKEGGGTGFLQDLLPRIIGLGLIIGIVMFFFIMLIGAIQWISSGGDKGAIEAARSKLTNALVGILLLLALFAIIKLLGDFFGVNILEIDLGPLKIGIPDTPCPLNNPTC